ncbi:hypothetical protein ACVWWN_006461 [Mycobacterium sp. URHB0021]
MESFVHLRKGWTPRRLQADLDGLKDDDLGRGGFTGRTANIYRRHDSSAYRSAGPLRPVDVLSSELKPSDAADARGALLPLFSNADCQVTSDSVHLPPTVHLFMQAAGVYVMNFIPKPADGVPGTERTPWYHRNVDYDKIAFFHGGSLYGIPMPVGLISDAPQGVHHGAPESTGAGPTQIRRLRQGRLVDDRHPHPPPACPVRGGTEERSATALMSACAKKRQH